MDSFEVVVECRSCGYRRSYSLAALAALLKLRRVRLNPAILKHHENRLVCTKCGGRSGRFILGRGPNTDLVADGDTAVADDSEQHPPKESTEEEGHLCSNCGRAIEAERLRPGVTLCRECEAGGVEREAEPTPEKCPRCGSVLVQRVRLKKGTSAYFIGCSRYPHCRYTEG